jgi:hypothetical protein
MAVTTNYGFRYPLKGDTRGTALDIQHLAEDVDAKIAADAANPPRPFWNFQRYTSGTLGTGADAPLISYDLQEANFTLGTPVQNGAVIAPRSGLYLVTVDITLIATWAGNPQCNIGAKTNVSAGPELWIQRNENNSAGGQRRSYSVSGMMRLAAGQEIWAFMNQSGGTGSVTHSNATNPGDRWTSRFSGLWIAP